MEEAASGSVQEVLERNDSRLSGLVGQRIASPKSCCTVVDEQRISIALHRSADLCLRNDVVSRHLFPEDTRSLAKLPFVRLLLHLRNLARRARWMFGQVRHEMVQ